jgi:flavin-binding protein dodecin
MPGHVYKVVELVGSSHEGIEDAIKGAIERASETLRNLDWFEVKEIRGNINEGRVDWYQVKLGVGFRVLEPGDLAREP